MTGRLTSGQLGGLPVWLSPVLLEAGVPHAFTTRRGGVSQPPFDELNLGDHVGDEPEQVTANRARLAAALGAEPDLLAWLYQVHGSHVVVRAVGERVAVQADGAVTQAPGLWLPVLVADCLPVLLAAGDGTAVAALHAGWRGLVDGVLERGVASLRALAGGALVAAIGPCIGVGRYAVGDEVAARFGEHVARVDGRQHVDLSAMAEARLRAAGVAAVDAYDGCVAEEPETFFSHRRDGGRTGRQAGLIAIRPA